MFKKVYIFNCKVGSLTVLRVHVERLRSQVVLQGGGQEDTSPSYRQCLSTHGPGHLSRKNSQKYRVVKFAKSAKHRCLHNTCFRISNVSLTISNNIFFCLSQRVYPGYTFGYLHQLRKQIDIQGIDVYDVSSPRAN